REERRKDGREEGPRDEHRQNRIRDHPTQDGSEPGATACVRDREVRPERGYHTDELWRCRLPSLCRHLTDQEGRPRPSLHLGGGSGYRLHIPEEYRGESRRRDKARRIGRLEQLLGQEDERAGARWD